MVNILNLAIITLLVVAIIYAMILNHRLNSFKEGKKEIIKTIHTFNQVVQNAETTLAQLQKSTLNISEQLKAEINKANLLRDDLVLILDKNARTKQARTPVTPSFSYASDKGAFARPSTTTKQQPVNIYQSDAEKELYQALQRLKGEA